MVNLVDSCGDDDAARPSERKKENSLSFFLQFFKHDAQEHIRDDTHAADAAQQGKSALQRTTPK